MIREYIQKIIDEETKSKRSDFLAMQKQIAELQIDLKSAKREIKYISMELEKYQNTLEETKDEAENAIMRMVQDTVLKLESYEEAAKAILGRR